MKFANNLREQAAALNRTAERQPPLRQGAVRRTSSLQVLWSEEDTSCYRIVGRARDIVAAANLRPTIIGEDSIEAQIGGDGRIGSMSGDRHADQLARFAGLRPGGELRKAMARALADEVRDETPLFRLLDDLAGAAFMSMAAWYAWSDGMGGHAARAGVGSVTDRPVEGVCLSYAPGSSSMTADGRGIDENADHPMGPLPLMAGDPSGFHDLAEFDGPNQWRLRRTDIWRQGSELRVDAWFQDSSAIEGDRTQRVIFHEYGIVARFDVKSLQLIEITVTPHVLPYVTCHASPSTAQVLVGQSAGELRDQVLARLRGTAGCTHLNDMLRALQDLVGLAAKLPAYPLEGTRSQQGSLAD